MSAVLEVEGVSKTFTRTKALAGVSMTIEPGEVHALLGQNGSGKSTLIKILSGYHAPDPGGGIRVEGHDLPLQSPVQSYRLGCRFVQQDLGLVSTLSVLDNMALGSGFPTQFGTINGKATYKQAKADLERLSLDIDPRALVATLSASDRTGVAIARALRDDPQYPACLLVLDEPTATLPVDEVDNLLDRVSAMAATGVGVLYVTHHLGEVFRVAHKVSVFRDGVVVGAGPVKDFDHAAIVQLLAGEELIAEETESRRQKAARAAARGHETVFQVEALRAGALAGVSFGVERGEIVGIAGLAGSGRDSVLGASFGALPRTAGDVILAGEALPPGRPDAAIARGIAYLAPDRKVGGGVMTMSARENLTLPDLKPFWKGLRLRRRNRDEEDQGLVRAALGQARRCRQRAAQHLQRWQPAEDSVRQVAVAEAVRVPSRRAHTGRRRGRQGRPPSRACHRGRGRRRSGGQLERSGGARRPLRPSARDRRRQDQQRARRRRADRGQHHARVHADRPRCPPKPRRPTGRSRS